MAATKPSRSAKRASATVIASGHRDEAGEEGKRTMLEKTSARARDPAAARTRRPRERRESTVGSSSRDDGGWRTKKEEWPRRRRRRSMESSAAEAEGESREVAAAARAAGEREPSHRRIAARGDVEGKEAAGLGFAAW
jgi:hypothetical protein